MEKWIERGARRAEKNRSDKKRELGISEEKKLRRQRIDDIIMSIYYLGLAGFCIYLIISIIFKYGIKDAVLAIIASSCFTIWLLIDGMKPFLHLIAKRKDWTRLASWSASKADKDEEQFLFKETDIHQIDFQPYPNVILSSDRKRELFY